MPRERRKRGGRGAQAGTSARGGLLREPAANERTEDDEAVAPGDLLSLVVLAAGVGDGHLVDAVTGAQDARRDLRVETPARLAQRRDLARHVGRENLVAGLHVRERGVV